MGKRGRRPDPELADGPLMTFRISDADAQALRHYAVDQRRKISDILREWIRDRLAKVRNAQQRPPE